MNQVDMISDFAGIDQAVAAMQDEHDSFKARIIGLAEGLNYWGKKLQSSKDAVITKIVDDEQEWESDDAAEYFRVQVAAILKDATKPKKPKAEKVAKEKAPDMRPVSAGALTHTEETRPVIMSAGNRFIVTSAQNNTEVHREFFANLKAYAEHLGAQLIVFPFIYNKNAFQNGEGNDDIWYSEEVRPYLQESSAWLGTEKKVAAMAFNILPTATNPLSGLKEAIGSAEAMIVPHASLAHECVAVLGAQYGRTVPGMYSTGTVTQRNYIQQAAGQKAENRHNFAALIVEFNEHGQFWIRQIETDESGCFSDLNNFVKMGEVLNDVLTVEVINYGDIHAEKLDNRVAGIQWGRSADGIAFTVPGRMIVDGPLSMLDYFRPNYQMAHDLLDFEALNHHNRENHYHMAGNAFSGRTVQDDLIDVHNVLISMQRDFCQTVVVRSNHDDALDRWLADNKYEPRKDPANALTYYGLQVEAYQHLKRHEHFDSLPIALNQAANDRGIRENLSVTFLRASQSYIVNGVELGEHGHSGVNGSRGSPKQFRGQRMTTGHTHTPSIYGHCYTAGVSGKLAMGYNETGASSWQHACVVQYKTGFRTIIHVKDNGAGQLAYMA